MSTPQATRLVLGAGPVGSAVARLLADRGEHVTVLTRSGGGPEHANITRVKGDAADAVTVTELAVASAAIYNCLNPDYHRWPIDWPPMATAALRAAEAHGAVLATVSNLYGYGPVDRPMTEDMPLAATGSKSKVRVAMWEQTLAAAQAGRARITEVRAADYLGAASQSQLGDRAIPKLLQGKGVQVLGDPDAAHSFTWTGDVARMLVLASDDERAWGKAWHVPTHTAKSMRATVADLARIVGVEPPKVSRVPGIALSVMGLFVPMIRELKEVAYQVDQPFVIDDSAARATFGIEPTPLDDILRDHLSTYSPKFAAVQPIAAQVQSR